MNPAIYLTRHIIYLLEYKSPVYIFNKYGALLEPVILQAAVLTSLKHLFVLNYMLLLGKIEINIVETF